MRPLLQSWGASRRSVQVFVEGAPCQLYTASSAQVELFANSLLQCVPQGAIQIKSHQGWQSHEICYCGLLSSSLLTTNAHCPVQNF